MFTFYFFCKLVASYKAEAIQGRELQVVPNPLSISYFAECVAERYQVPGFMSLVRSGQGFKPTTLRTGDKHLALDHRR